MLTEKVVLILGASGGLGTYVTSAALAAGAKVIGVSRSIRPEEFPHPNFTALPAEISGPEAAQKVVDTVAAQFGRVDAVMHLVGAFAAGASVDQSDDALFEKMLTVNFRPALHVFRAVVPLMRKQGAGRILAVGSKAAMEPSAMTGAYNVSKAALLSLVRTVAEENKATGISANIVLPGTMDTPANRAAMPDADPNKWVQPAQVANLLVFLASEAASQITGAAIPVYGSS